MTTRRERRAGRVLSEVRLLTARLICDGYTDIEIADAMIEMSLVLMSPEVEEGAA